MNRRLVKTIFPLLTALTVLALNGCGESKEDKALASVCASKADIEKQVDKLAGLELAPDTTDEVQQFATAVSKDLQSIEAQIPALGSSLQSQVQQASAKFKSDIATIALDVADSVSIKEGKAQATKSFSGMKDAYQQAFSSLKCP